MNLAIFRGKIYWTSSLVAVSKWGEKKELEFNNNLQSLLCLYMLLLLHVIKQLFLQMDFKHSKLIHSISHSIVDLEVASFI
jgi:hypothetical protein